MNKEKEKNIEENKVEAENPKVLPEELAPVVADTEEASVDEEASPDVEVQKVLQAKKTDSGFIEKVIALNRVTKVTKGGKKLSFSALVVVGDGNGKVGYSLGKASEVAIAIRKALARAKKNMIKINLKGSTITHQINGQCGGAVVMLKPASEGTGVIAAGPVRAVCDGAGIRNILTKCHRSNNAINVVKATMDGLCRLKKFEKVELDSNLGAI